MSEEIDRTPAIGLYLSGESFMLAAQHLSRSVDAKTLRLRFDSPIYYLYSHALELVLKAFLRAKGVTVEELKDGKKFGHQLMKLHKGVIERGLDLEGYAEFVKALLEMIAELGRNDEFRYLKVGYARLPVLHDLQGACDILYQKIGVTVRATVPNGIPPQQE